MPFLRATLQSCHRSNPITIHDDHLLEDAPPLHDHHHDPSNETLLSLLLPLLLRFHHSGLTATIFATAIDTATVIIIAVAAILAAAMHFQIDSHTQSNSHDHQLHAFH